MVKNRDLMKIIVSNKVNFRGLANLKNLILEMKLKFKLTFLWPWNRWQTSPRKPNPPGPNPSFPIRPGAEMRFHMTVWNVYESYQIQSEWRTRDIFHRSFKVFTRVQHTRFVRDIISLSSFMSANELSHYCSFKSMRKVNWPFTLTKSKTA